MHWAGAMVMHEAIIRKESDRVLMALRKLQDQVTFDGRDHAAITHASSLIHGAIWQLGIDTVSVQHTNDLRGLLSICESAGLITCGHNVGHAAMHIAFRETYGAYSPCSPLCAPRKECVTCFLLCAAMLASMGPIIPSSLIPSTLQKKFIGAGLAIWSKSLMCVLEGFKLSMFICAAGTSVTLEIFLCHQ